MRGRLYCFRVPQNSHIVRHLDEKKRAGNLSEYIRQLIEFDIEKPDLAAKLLAHLQVAPPPPPASTRPDGFSGHQPPSPAGETGTMSHAPPPPDNDMELKILQGLARLQRFGQGGA